MFLEEDVSITVYSLDGSSDEDGEESVVGVTSPRKVTKIKSPPPAASVRSTPTKRKATEEKEDGHEAAVSSPKKQMTIKDMFSRGNKENEKRKRKAEASVDDEATPEKAAKVDDDDLPNMFDGFLVVLNDDVDKDVSKTLQRYVVAYGGEVLDAFKAAEATHVVYGSKRKLKNLLDGVPKKAKHVSERYFLESIKEGSLQKNMAKYKVG